MTFIVVYQSEFEATLVLNGRQVQLWHADGNVRHLVNLMTEPSKAVVADQCHQLRTYMDDDTSICYVEALPA